MTDEEKTSLKAAYNLLNSYGILCYVPGCYDISDDEEAVEYASDADQFYAIRNRDW